MGKGPLQAFPLTLTSSLFYTCYAGYNFPEHKHSTCHFVMWLAFVAGIRCALRGYTRAFFSCNAHGQIVVIKNQAKCHIINYLLTLNVWYLQDISNLCLAILTLLSLCQYSKVSVGDFPIKTSVLVLVWRLFKQTGLGYEPPSVRIFSATILLVGTYV